MQAILITPGPVATCKAVKRTKMSLVYILTQQFIDAAKELEQRNFGTLMEMPTAARSLHLFLKKTPQEVEHTLNANPGLCDFETYTRRYKKGSSKVISFQHRAKLVSMKLVSPEHFM